MAASIRNDHKRAQQQASEQRRAAASGEATGEDEENHKQPQPLTAHATAAHTASLQQWCPTPQGSLGTATATTSTVGGR
jgi:hypothetical protein